MDLSLKRKNLLFNHLKNKLISKRPWPEMIPKTSPPKDAFFFLCLCFKNHNSTKIKIDLLLKWNGSERPKTGLTSNLITIDTQSTNVANKAACVSWMQIASMPSTHCWMNVSDGSVLASARRANACLTRFKSSLYHNRQTCVWCWTWAK